MSAVLSQFDFLSPAAIENSDEANAAARRQAPVCAIPMSDDLITAACLGADQDLTHHPNWLLRGIKKLNIECVAR